MAEAIAWRKIAERGLSGRIEVDSAGTGDWHIGSLPHPKTQQVARAHGADRFSPARQVHASDFEDFDLLIAMDERNELDLRDWRGAKPERIRRMLEWGEPGDGDNVPDPYYGGIEDYRHVYRLLDGAIDRLLDELFASPANPGP